MIRAALWASSRGSASREHPSASTFDHGALGVPPHVGLAHLYVSDLVVRYLDALHFPFSQLRTGIDSHHYKGSAATFTYLVILSVLAHEKNLAPVHNWKRGLGHQGNIGFITHIGESQAVCSPLSSLPGFRAPTMPGATHLDVLTWSIRVIRMHSLAWCPVL